MAIDTVFIGCRVDAQTEIDWTANLYAITTYAMKMLATIRDYRFAYTDGFCPVDRTSLSFVRPVGQLSPVLSYRSDKVCVCPRARTVASGYL